MYEAPPGLNAVDDDHSSAPEGLFSFAAIAWPFKAGHRPQDVLLFHVVRQSPDYSIVKKDHGCLHLRLVGQDGEPVPSREIYIEVTGIDALWEHVRQYKEQHKIRDLFTQKYGMREFHIIAPNGCLVFVGECV